MNVRLKKYLSVFLSVLLFACTFVPAGAQLNDELSQISIKQPSVTAINYGDAIVLHLDTAGELPENCTVVWSVDDESVVYLNPSCDGSECYVTSAETGTITITAALVDTDGNVLTDAQGNEISDSLVLQSRAGILQRILFLIRRIFLSPRVLDQDL